MPARVILIPVDDRDRNLAIADEAPTLWDVTHRRGRGRKGYRLRWGCIVEPEGTAHLRLGCTEACVI